jgi:hypothetical protein
MAMEPLGMPCPANEGNRSAHMPTLALACSANIRDSPRLLRGGMR